MPKDVAYEILGPLQPPPGVAPEAFQTEKAQVWEDFRGAKDKDDLTARLQQRQNIPNNIKRQLWDQWALPATAATKEPPSVGHSVARGLQSTMGSLDQFASNVSGAVGKLGGAGNVGPNLAQKFSEASGKAAKQRQKDLDADTAAGGAPTGMGGKIAEGVAGSIGTVLPYLALPEGRIAGPIGAGIVGAAQDLDKGPVEALKSGAKAAIGAKALGVLGDYGSKAVAKYGPKLAGAVSKIPGAAKLAGKIPAIPPAAARVGTGALVGAGYGAATGGDPAQIASGAITGGALGALGKPKETKAKPAEPGTGFTMPDREAATARPPGAPVDPRAPGFTQAPPKAPPPVERGTGFTMPDREAVAVVPSEPVPGAEDRTRGFTDAPPKAPVKPAKPEQKTIGAPVSADDKAIVRQYEANPAEERTPPNKRRTPPSRQIAGKVEDPSFKTASGKQGPAAAKQVEAGLPGPTSPTQVEPGDEQKQIEGNIEQPGFVTASGHQGPPNPAMLTATDDQGDSVSQPAAGVKAEGSSPAEPPAPAVAPDEPNPADDSPAPKGGRMRPAEGEREWRYGDPAPLPDNHVAMNTADIHVDPERFQYKAGAVGRAGVTDEYAHVTKFNKDAAGSIHVWMDPADGKVYVTNGHHRLEMANRLGADQMSVKFIDAPDAKTARVKSAITNILDDKGTSLDAAKIFRDSGMTPDELRVQEGINPKGKVAEQGVALSGLSDRAFMMVVNNDLLPSHGAAIGERLRGQPKRQDSFIDWLKTQKVRYNADQIGDIVDQWARADAEGGKKGPLTVKDLNPQKGMFDDDGEFDPDKAEENYYGERALVQDEIRAKLKDDKRLFGMLGKPKNVDTIQGAGAKNVLDVEGNRNVAQQATQVLQMFQKEIKYNGLVDKLMLEAGKEVANGRSKEDVAADAYPKVRAEIERLLGRFNAQ